MTITVKLDDAKADLADLLTIVERGEDVVIARDGKPVARLVRIADARTERGELIETILAERSARKPATADEIDSWKREGRQ